MLLRLSRNLGDSIRRRNRGIHKFQADIVPAAVSVFQNEGPGDAQGLQKNHGVFIGGCK